MKLEERIFEADPTWYDADVKRKYLETVSDSEKQYVYFFLNNMSKHELLYDEPIYNLSTENIELFFFSLMPLTMLTSYKAIGYAIRYMRFAVDLGVKRSNILLIDNSFDYAKRFIPQGARTHINFDQLQSLIAACNNDQDKVIFQMSFEGLKGPLASELRFLKITDLHFVEKNGQFHYFIDVNNDRGPVRTLPITKNLYYMCHRAYKQERYFLNNGEFISQAISNRRGDSQALIDTQHILKRAHIGINAQDKVKETSYHALYQRVLKIKKYQSFEGIDPDFLRFTSIYESGAIYEAYLFINQSYANGKIDQHDPEQRKALYSQVDWPTLRQQVCSKFVHLKNQKIYDLISPDTLIKYY